MSATMEDDQMAYLEISEIKRDWIWRYRSFVISLMVVWIMVKAVFNLEVGMRSPDERKVGEAKYRALENSDREGLKSREKNICVEASEGEVRGI